MPQLPLQASEALLDQVRCLKEVDRDLINAEKTQDGEHLLAKCRRLLSEAEQIESREGQGTHQTSIIRADMNGSIVGTLLHGNSVMPLIAYPTRQQQASSSISSWRGPQTAPINHATSMYRTDSLFICNGAYYAPPVFHPRLAGSR